MGALFPNRDRGIHGHCFDRCSSHHSGDSIPGTAVALDIADVPTRVHKIDANLSMQDLWEK